MNMFRDIARILQPYISDTYDLLNAADDVLGILPPEPVAPKAVFPFDALLACARGSNEVMNAIYDSKKINAIKELRGLTGCSLMDAKNAVEHVEVGRPPRECSE